MNPVRSLLALGTLCASLAAPLAAQPVTITVPMKALNSSGESGVATLTQEAGGVKVTISLKNAPSSDQPTHIHIGTCDNIKKSPEYALVNTTNGQSTTVVSGVTLGDLLKGHYAINVHKSSDDLGTYVSCGDIK